MLAHRVGLEDRGSSGNDPVDVIAVLPSPCCVVSWYKRDLGRGTREWTGYTSTYRPRHGSFW